MIRASCIAALLRAGSAGRFRRDERGVAAVEFAMLVPLMMFIFFGTAELTQGFSANRKLTFLARDLADIAAQNTTLTNTGSAASAANTVDVSTVFSAAAGVLYPFLNPRMTLTGIVFKTGTDSKVHAYTDWSVQSNSGTLRPCGELQRTSAAGTAAPAVPDGLFVAGTTVIAADVSYSYTPLVGSTFLGIGGNAMKFGSGSITSIPMSKTSYMQPRQVTRVSYTGSTGACSGVTFP